MNTVTYTLNVHEIVPIFTDFIINDIIDTKVKQYEGKVCYSNYYWYKCQNMENMSNEIEDILKKYDFIGLLKIFCESSIWTFTHIAEIIDLGYMEDYQQFRDRLEYFNFGEGQKAKELFEKLDEFFEKYNKLFDCYERITLANAKALLTKAIYNPKTPLGKIHVNHLYDENF